MNRFFTFSRCAFLLTVLLALAACKPAAPQATATSAPTVTVTPTPPPTVTQPLAPTRRLTSTPRPTQTLHPTLTAPASLTPRPPSTTPTPLVTSLFSAAIEPFQSSHQTSTPIATPGSSPNDFILKAWSEADAITLIKALDEYADANDLCFPAGCIRNNFVSFQEPIELALQETLWRFPNTANVEQYQWRLALANVIQGTHDSDQWLLAKLESLLNETQLPLESLGDFIEPQGFYIGSPYFFRDEIPAIFPNLFGDQTDVPVYRLTTLGSLLDGLFFAVRTNARGEQKIIPIYSDWNFNTADDHIVDFADHNLNGFPEIVFYNGAHSGNMCIGDVLVFEWQGEKFIQKVDQGNYRKTHITDCTSDWGYSEPDENGVERLYVHNSFTFFTDYFKWDGQYYRFDERSYEIKSDYGLAREIERLTREPKPAEAIKLLNETLLTLQNQTSEFGPSTWDYFHFQLGLLYAVQSMPDEARTQFESVAKTPLNPSITAIPQAAQAFLDHYTDNTSVYRACNAALDVMQTALDPFRDADGNVTEQQMIQAWGYTDAPPLYPLCNFDLVLPSITWQFDANQMADAPTALHAAGVTVEHSARLDLDGDNNQDWIVVVTKPYATERTDATLWALLQEPNGLLALRVNGNYPRLDRQSAYDTFAVQTVSLPGGNEPPIIITQSGDGLFAFQVLRSEKSGPYLHDVSYYYWSRVTAYTLKNSPYGPRITITSPDPGNENASIMQSYLWDGSGKRFKPEEDVLAGLAPWEEGAAAKVIPALQSIVNSPPPVCDENYPEGCDQLLTERSRYHYLLALAYELTGDETAAVQTYWQLWHDFPHSPYALMARAKLEPR